MADQLCTTAQVKARIFPAGVTDTGDDTVISELIDQTSDYIEQYTGRKLVPVASADYYFDTVAGYVLRVPIGIRAVTFMGVNNLTHQPDSGGTYTTVPASDYLLRPKPQDGAQGWPFMEVQISRGTLAGTIAAFGNIANGCKLTMTTGFAATPPDIQSVCIDAVVAAFQARKDGASGVIGSELGALTPWSDFFGPGSPQRGTLDRYRYIGFG
jgi:hypothetical protein